MFFLEMFDFQFLPVFPNYFNNYRVDLLVCKFTFIDCDMYFLCISLILQMLFIFYTPRPRPPEPSRGPLGPPLVPPPTLQDVPADPSKYHPEQQAGGGLPPWFLL